MNLQTCRTCGHLFNFCGCPGKTKVCNECNPSQGAGPRVERNGKVITPITPYQVQDIGRPQQLPTNCHHTLQQVQFWKLKVIDLKISGHLYKLGLTIADVNRMMGNLESALNTSNYCFQGVNEAEAAVVLAMMNGY